MGTRQKVVIDTNVIVSAFGWRGKPWDILSMLQRGTVINHSSAALLAELQRVVAYPKLKFNEAVQSDILEFVLANSRIVVASPLPNIAIADPDDLHVIACATAAKASYIITGDPHLIALGCCNVISILTPSDFLQR
jgi:putative PIN family toxin of toxin-antitoxin system